MSIRRFHPSDALRRGGVAFAALLLAILGRAEPAHAAPHASVTRSSLDAVPPSEAGPAVPEVTPGTR